VLNDVSEILVLSIGLGVGVAAIIGVLRSLRGWSLKPLIAIRYALTLGTHIVKLKDGDGTGTEDVSGLRLKLDCSAGACNCNMMQQMCAIASCL
jgi:hypothetical protein